MLLAVSCTRLAAAERDAEHHSQVRGGVREGDRLTSRCRVVFHANVPTTSPRLQGSQHASISIGRGVVLRKHCWRGGTYAAAAGSAAQPAAVCNAAAH
jgi:hypothetical protein